MQINGDYKMVPPVVMASATWGTTGGTNTHPVANGDSYSVAQDTTLTVDAPGVLGNDTDADGGALTAVQDSSAGNGDAVLNADGSFSYTPNADFTGSDSFTYHAVDSNDANSNNVTVTILVTRTATMACADYADKGSCQNDPNCTWEGSPRNGSCVDSNPPVCESTPGQENAETSCTDGFDNDCDGAVDCSDADCSADPACQQADCSTYGTKDTCNAQAICRWDNKNKTCTPN